MSTTEDTYGSIHGIPVLKAIAKTSGDGWKDASVKGETLFVWAVTGVYLQPPKHISLLRIGYVEETSSWTLSENNYELKLLSEHEYYQLKRLVGNNTSEADKIHEGIKSGSYALVGDIQALVRRTSTIAATVTKL